MVNYKEILRLASEGTSQRQIAVSVGHSRDTVSEFLAAAKVHNLSLAAGRIRNQRTDRSHPLPGTSLCYQYVP